MARKTKKTKAQVNKQLWDRANTSNRTKWQSTSQKSYDFYLIYPQKFSYFCNRKKEDISN